MLGSARTERGSQPPLKRIVVAIDPAVTVSDKADETGKNSPIEWARRAVSLYRKWSADRVIAEVNNGGMMVETTLRTVDASVSYLAVHASRGKIVRAEPVSALFEQDKVSLVGSFPELEDQLCSFTPGSTASPDRLDALVWAFTELMVGRQTPPAVFGSHGHLLATSRFNLPAPDWWSRGDMFPPHDSRWNLPDGKMWVAAKLAAGAITEEIARERGWIQ